MSAACARRWPPPASPPLTPSRPSCRRASRPVSVLRALRATVIQLARHARWFTRRS